MDRETWWAIIHGVAGLYMTEQLQSLSSESYFIPLLTWFQFFPLHFLICFEFVMFFSIKKNLFLCFFM